MKAILVALAFVATAVTAQTSSACAADYIVEACLSTENDKLNGCGDNDYNCKCNAYGDLITCFNNCPGDSRVHTYEGQKQIFCGYASQFPSSTTKAKGAAKTSAGSSPATTTADSTATAASGKATGTPTGTGASSTKSNSAADLALNAGGVLAAVAGVVAAVL